MKRFRRIATRYDTFDQTYLTAIHQALIYDSLVYCFKILESVIMKIAIITMHAARNYGAVLQTFALQEYCNKQGLSVEIVNYKRYNQTNIGYLFSINKKFQDSNLKKILFFIKTIIPKIKTTKLFSSFLKRRLNITKHEILVNSKLNLIPQAEVYCVGSDQVWNPCANNGLDKMYFFDGVKGKKISYASSIGVQEVNDDTKNLYKKYLSSFDSVSVSKTQAKSTSSKPKGKITNDDFNF